MITQPEVYLDDLSKDEKQLLTAIARKQLVRMGILLLPPAFALGFVLVYFNMYSKTYELDETKLGILNAVTVIGVVLAIRFFVSYAISLSKESKSWQKRVIHGKVHGKKGTTVFIGRQRVRLNSAQAASVNVDDEVEIGVSTHAAYVIYVQKKEKPASAPTEEVTPVEPEPEPDKE